MKSQHRVWGLLLTAFAGAGVMLAVRPGAGDDAPAAPAKKAEVKDADPALSRTRKTVRMLDDIYKGAIVLITDKYVRDENDLPAGSAFKALFAAVKKKGWHEVRLVDATNDPIAPGNAPREGFEKAGIQQLLAGKDYYEQVETQPGKRVLHAVTAIPVVMKKCILCHPHYADAKPGQAIGALSYTIDIE